MHSRSRVISDQQSISLGNGVLLLLDFLNVHCLTVCPLNFVHSFAEVPESTLGNDLVYGENAHPIDGRVRVGFGGDLAAGYHPLLDPCADCRVALHHFILSCP